MKKDSLLTPSSLPVLTLIAGGLGLLLRLFQSALPTTTPAMAQASRILTIFLYIFSVAVLALLVVCVWPLKPHSRSPRKYFRSSTKAALGCSAGGVGVLITAMSSLMQSLSLANMIGIILAAIAALCFGFLAFARQKGSRPHFLVPTGLVVYLMYHLISRYRLWSPVPQLLSYVFPLLASVFLMLTAFHSLCLDSGKGDRRLYVFFNQAALYCCCLSLPNEQPFFYLGMGIWLATNLCSLRVSRSRSAEPAPSEAAQENLTEPKEG